MQNRGLIIFGIGILVVVAVVGVLLTREAPAEPNQDEANPVAQDEAPHVSLAPAVQSEPETTETVPAQPDQKVGTAVNEQTSEPPPASTVEAIATPGRPAGTNAPDDPGTMSSLNADAFPQIQAALQPETRDPTALSPMFQPVAFDKAAYLKNPQAYIAAVKPGRVFQPAQPGPDVPLLKALGARSRTVPAGASIPLGVRTEPGMPVTFTSFALGSFSNHLTSITVAADQYGIATTTFHASAGTYGLCRLMAASPVASGQARFEVTITAAASTDLTPAPVQAGATPSSPPTPEAP